MSQTHLAGGALFTAARLGVASAAGWMHAPAWAPALGIAWGALAGELPDIDHRPARVSRAGVAFGVADSLLGAPVRIVGMFIRALQVKHRGPTHSLTLPQTGQHPSVGWLRGLRTAERSSQPAHTHHEPRLVGTSE